MKKTSCGILGALALLAAAQPARAQGTPISIDARVGAVLPFGDWGNLARTGTEVRGGVTFHASSIIGIYGGYGWARYDTESGLGDGHWTEQGFNAGVNARIVPRDGGSLVPFFRAGVIVHQLSATDAGGTVKGDHKVGVEVGTGVEFQVRPRITVMPTVGYSQFDPGVANFDVTNIHLGVGASFRI